MLQEKRPAFQLLQTKQYSTAWDLKSLDDTTDTPKESVIRYRYKVMVALQILKTQWCSSNLLGRSAQLSVWC